MKFMRETRQNDKINFGHLFVQQDSSHKIARVPKNNAPWVIPIGKIEIFHEH